MMVVATRISASCADEREHGFFERLAPHLAVAMPIRASGTIDWIRSATVVMS